LIIFDRLTRKNDSIVLMACVEYYIKKRKKKRKKEKEKQYVANI